MKFEIKEILDRLDYNEWEVDLYKVPISWFELYDIRDYITNLQEENERLNSLIDETIKHLENEQKGLEDWDFDGYDPRLDILIKELKENK